MTQYSFRYIITHSRAESTDTAVDETARTGAII